MDDYKIYRKRFLNELNEKIIGFSESDLEASGYYYLIDLIYKLPQLRHRNINNTYAEVKNVIEEFPISNNGKIHYHQYFYHLNALKTFIRKEYGFFPNNKIFNRYFWWIVFIGFILSFYISFIGLILGGVIGYIMAKNREKKAYKKGNVLGKRL